MSKHRNKFFSDKSEADAFAEAKRAEGFRVIVSDGSEPGTCWVYYSN